MLDEAFESYIHDITVLEEKSANSCMHSAIQHSLGIFALISDLESHSFLGSDGTDDAVDEDLR